MYVTPHVMHLTSLHLISREKYGNHYTVGSSKRSSYVDERMRKHQNKFLNSFYRFKFDLFALSGGSLKET